MLEIAFYTVALTLAAWAVWVRRACWRIPFERTTTSAIVQLMAALVLIGPATKPYTGWLFFELTGRWHVDDLLGHMLALGALVSSNIAGMMRLPTMRRYMDPLLWTPLVIGTAVLMQLFWRSSATHNPGHDLLAVPHHQWLSAYFALLWALLVYYWALNAWVALNHLRGDPRSRPVALTWLVCIGLGAVAMLGWLVPPWARSSGATTAGWPCAPPWLSSRSPQRARGSASSTHIATSFGPQARGSETNRPRSVRRPARRRRGPSRPGVVEGIEVLGQRRGARPRRSARPAGGVAMGGMPAVEGMPFSTSAEILFAGSRVVGIHSEAVGYFRDRLRSAPS